MKRKRINKWNVHHKKRKVTKNELIKELMKLFVIDVVEKLFEIGYDYRCAERIKAGKKLCIPLNKNVIKRWENMEINDKCLFEKVIGRDKYVEIIDNIRDGCYNDEVLKYLLNPLPRNKIKYKNKLYFNIGKLSIENLHNIFDKLWNIIENDDDIVKPESRISIVNWISSFICDGNNNEPHPLAISQGIIDLDYPKSEHSIFRFINNDIIIPKRLIILILSYFFGWKLKLSGCSKVLKNISLINGSFYFGTLEYIGRKLEYIDINLDSIFRYPIVVLALVKNIRIYLNDLSETDMSYIMEKIVNVRILHLYQGEFQNFFSFISNSNFSFRRLKRIEFRKCSSFFKKRKNHSLQLIFPSKSYFPKLNKLCLPIFCNTFHFQGEILRQIREIILLDDTSPLNARLYGGFQFNFDNLSVFPNIEKLTLDRIFRNPLKYSFDNLKNLRKLSIIIDNFNYLTSIPANDNIRELELKSDEVLNQGEYESFITSVPHKFKLLRVFKVSCGFLKYNFEFLKAVYRFFSTHCSYLDTITYVMDSCSSTTTDPIYLGDNHSVRRFLEGFNMNINGNISVKHFQLDLNVTGQEYSDLGEGIVTILRKKFHLLDFQTFRFKIDFGNATKLHLFVTNSPHFDKNGYPNVIEL